MPQLYHVDAKVLYSQGMLVVLQKINPIPLRVLQYSNDPPSLAVNFLYSPPSLTPMSDQDTLLTISIQYQADK